MPKPRKTPKPKPTKKKPSPKKRADFDPNLAAKSVIDRIIERTERR